ncbi:beta-class carbonic anhydrase [Peribacillus deserti]|uniref:carbonic anhydrase n=1 Tax=Peribacillus deserti TaxID=673318 RepID=A0A2N5M2W8_9BACI|nr:carbonic anhydrase [Peribacillus deserti]PLT28700.1 carbonic anhydrase [Peribacillus deserti]
MSLLNEILTHNEQFVENQEYRNFQTDKFPDKKLVVLSCMDTRLVELLPKALNFKNGDVKVIKNAGAVIAHPFGSIVRSLVVAVYELGAEEILVVGHHDCGMSGMDPDRTISSMKQRGITEETLSTLEHAGIDLHKWLEGFKNVSETVAHSVSVIQNHPLIAKDIPVHGLVIDPATGKLDVVVDGYK